MKHVTNERPDEGAQQHGLQRREFLAAAGLGLGALAASPTLGAERTARAKSYDPSDWRSIREQFALTPSLIHMSTFLLTSHPRPVAASIEKHRRAFEADPVGHWHEHFMTIQPTICQSAAEYMGGDPNNIALTDSTTQGLGVVYGSIHLEPHQEAVCSTHCHYSTQMSLQHRAERTGAKTRQAMLYADPANVSMEEILRNTKNAISDNTRVFATTWVHSSTGVKLPIREMARVIEKINASRPADDRVIFCVDGVHGFGVEDHPIEEMGCDFFMAGTHKWMFGPRGTGVIWAKPGAWEKAGPIIPSFSPNYMVWMGYMTRDQVAPGQLNSPGGFHAFEHRWALPEAFRFHLDIGKRRIQDRIHELNTMAKREMAGMRHVHMHTPMDASLSSGIICFEVDGLSPDEVVERFHKEGITASTSPYKVSYPRLAPSILNNEHEVEQCMRVLAAMA